jgi:hypothetical protein
MKIEKVDWLSEEAYEAEVYISDGINKLVCFSCPFRMHLDDSVSHLYATFVDSILRLDIDDYSYRYKGGYSYDIGAKVVDVVEPCVEIFGIIIALDAELPGDIIVGDFVSFECGRLDI